MCILESSSYSSSIPLYIVVASATKMNVAPRLNVETWMNLPSQMWIMKPPTALEMFWIHRHWFWWIIPEVSSMLPNDSFCGCRLRNLDLLGGVIVWGCALCAIQRLLFSFLRVLLLNLSFHFKNCIIFCFHSLSILTGGLDNLKLANQFCTLWRESDGKLMVIQLWSFGRLQRCWIVGHPRKVMHP